MKCKRRCAMCHMMNGGTGDIASSTQDRYADLAPTSNVNDILDDIATWGHIDDDGPLCGVDGLGYMEAVGLGLVL